jgi:hypothetical protein
MNCEVFSLSPLRCEPFQVKEVLRAVLHTILFSRTLGVVRPRDVDSELFDLTYATCGDQAARGWGGATHSAREQNHCLFFQLFPPLRNTSSKRKCTSSHAMSFRDNLPFLPTPLLSNLRPQTVRVVWRRIVSLRVGGARRGG